MSRSSPSCSSRSSARCLAHSRVLLGDSDTYYPSPTQSWNLELPSHTVLPVAAGDSDRSTCVRCVSHVEHLVGTESDAERYMPNQDFTVAEREYQQIRTGP